MSNVIVVPLNEMQQLAAQWRATVTEMDGMVQQIARDLAAIPDNGKGLNEVRSRGRTVGSHHQQLLAQGMVVQKHVLDSVQRFTQADQELSGMVRSGGGALNGIGEWLLAHNSGLLPIGAVVTGLVDSQYAVPAPGSLDRLIEFTHSDGLTDTLIDFVNDASTVNESGMWAIASGKFAKFAKFNEKLNLWPTESGMKASDKLANKFGYAITGLTMLKGGIDAISAYQQGDGQKGREAVVGAITTGLTFALTKAIPGVGTVLLVSDGLQLAGKGIASGLEYFGYKGAADTVRNVLGYMDLSSHLENATKWLVNKTWDAVAPTLSEKFKQATDFVDRSADTVKNAASGLYEGAKTMANDFKNKIGGWLPSWGI